MKPDFGKSFAVDYAGHPAHMSAIDFVLWQRFRRREPLRFERLYFDVAVGAGAPLAGTVDQKIIDAWQRITRQRIDVVGEGYDAWTLIELRGAAGPGAIGSLVVYRDLWALDPPDTKGLDLWLVTDVFPTNLQPSLDALNIRLFLV